MKTRYVSPPPAWGAKAAAVPASAGARVGYLWRAVAGWLADIRCRFGSPAQLAGAGRPLPGLRPRLRALEALIRCLVLEAARRLAPSLSVRPSAGPSGNGRTSSGDTVGTPARVARPDAPSAPPDAADPEGWRVSFAWSGVEASPPKPATVRGGRAQGPRIAVIELSGEWTPLGRASSPVMSPDPCEPSFTGRFGPCPAPRWRYFPELHGQEAPAAAPAGGLPHGFAASARSVRSGVSPGAIRRAWALAARLEAVGRILLDPEPHVRRMARRLAAPPAGAASVTSARRAFTPPPRPLGSSGPRMRWLRSDLRDLLHDADLAWNAFTLAGIDSS